MSNIRAALAAFKKFRQAAGDLIWRRNASRMPSLDVIIAEQEALEAARLAKLLAKVGPDELERYEASRRQELAEREAYLLSIPIEEKYINGGANRRHLSAEMQEAAGVQWLARVMKSMEEAVARDADFVEIPEPAWLQWTEGT